MRLKQYSKHKACYYCGAAASITKEHAPPRLMFEAFDCDSITVPACAKHNTTKAGHDRGAVTVLIKGLDRAMNEGYTSEWITPNVIHAIEQLRPQFSQANREIEDRSLLSDSELDFKVPGFKFNMNDWIRQLSAAIVWSVTGKYDPSIDWNDAYVWQAETIYSSEPQSLYAVLNTVFMNRMVEIGFQARDWSPGWSAMPKSYPHDIYDFQICFQRSEDPSWQQIGIRHLFYSTTVWYIWFAASLETEAALKEAATQVRLEIGENYWWRQGSESGSTGVEEQHED